MLLIRNTIFCVILCLKFSLYEGSLVEEKQNVVPDKHTSAITGWKCNSNLDCTVANYTCINSICQCPAGYIYNSKATLCIKVATAYGDSCEESIQCSRYLFNGATCSNNICMCAEGYYYMRGQCNTYSGLFEKCNKDDDCYVSTDLEAARCSNGSCECNSGYYQREYRTCRPKGKAVGEECFINNDCTFNSTAYCDEYFKCAIPKEHTNMSELYKPDYILQNYADQAGNASVQTACLTERDCKSMGNAICGPSKVCICNRKYFFMKDVGKCVAELGETCNEGEEPSISDSQCRNKKWNCVYRKTPSKDRRSCIKLIKSNTLECVQDEQCSIFGPDSMCNGTCICNEKSRFIESELFCWTKKGFNETCQQDKDCYVEGINVTLSCTSGKCSCPKGTRLNFNQTNCIESPAGIGMACEDNSGCAVNNSICKNDVCSCNATYYESKGQCLPGINSTCTRTSNCTVQDSECVLGHCKCKEKYVAASYGLCQLVASFGEPCQHDVQCSTILPNTVCKSVNDTAKTCHCIEGYHYKFNKCAKTKVLGKSCDNLAECYLDMNDDRVVCRNGICTCNWGYTQVNDTVCGINSNTPNYWNSGRIMGLSSGLLSTLLFISIINLL